MHSAVELSESLRAGKRLENFKQNVPDEIHREEDERESNCYHCDRHGETSRQNLTNLVWVIGQKSRARIPVPFGFDSALGESTMTEFWPSVQYCTL
jgi:hypothetical protein